MGIPFPRVGVLRYLRSRCRRACGQGHRSGAGAQSCETCGEPLLAPPDPAAGGEPAAPVLDYTSGSFADFMAAAEPDPGGASAGGSGLTQLRTARPGLTDQGRPGRG